jgi:hypothetical protein
MRNQFIYRQERYDKFSVENRENSSFIFCNNPLNAFTLWHQLVLALGFAHFLKLVVKLFTPIRMFYCVIVQNQIAGYGYVTASRCKHYPVEKEAIVIGPVMTSEDFRSRGIATFALKKTINELILKDFHIFYIDTSEMNFQMQRVISKCAFGEPIDRAPRTRGRFV